MVQLEGCYVGFLFLSGCKPEEQLNCDSKQNNMAICRIRDRQNKKIPN